MVFAWLLSRPGLSAVIPGASRLAQLEENCAAADWALSADEAYQIDRILATPEQGA